MTLTSKELVESAVMMYRGGWRSENIDEIAEVFGLASDAKAIIKLCLVEFEKGRGWEA